MRAKKPWVIIQARMGSVRLPGKVMKPLLNKPVLWHVVNRASNASHAAGVIVATTLNDEDDVIDRFCKNSGFTVFRGSDGDVLDRYYQCATTYQMSDIVRITADCPLHDPSVVDKVICEYLRSNCDYVTNVLEYTYPDGLDVEVFSFNTLEQVWRSAKLPSEREHVTTYLRNSKRFKIKNVYAPKKYPAYRLTLDSFDDYQFISKIYEAFGRDQFSLDEVVEFLEKRPDLLKTKPFA
jgi:spore coat polysaccharide biosynthesis protein SpsF